MGIQIKNNKNLSIKRTICRSKNIYLNLLIKIYRFLARKTKSKFNIVVLKRLFSSRLNQSSISLSNLAKYSKGGNRILVVVGKVLNDERMPETPKLTICALKFSSAAKQRILNSNGTIITFDQLAKNNPMGKNTILLRGKKIKKAGKKMKNLISKKNLK